MDYDKTTLTPKSIMTTTTTGTNLTSTTTISATSSLPYIVAHCQELGRYLIAAKDLDKGEIILQEYPLTSGPERDSVLICPGCYESPNQDQNCEKCGWPLCSRNCSQIDRHLMNECELLSGVVQKDGEERNWKLLSDCIMIIRCLSLKYNDPIKWKTLLNMEANWKQWSQSPLFQRAEETISILREEFGILHETQYTTQEMLTVQAILDINAYEVRMPHINIQASYALACLAEHNCVPNTHKTISSSTLQLTLRATVDIPKGTNLTTSYCDILWPTAQRQQYLQWSKFFICKCARCQDSSEMGTLLSALYCPACSIETPIFPNLSTIDKLESGINRDFNYNCSRCFLSFDASLVENVLTTAEEELQELDLDQTNEKSTEYEKWLLRWTTSIPANTNKGVIQSVLHDDGDSSTTTINNINNKDISTSKTTELSSISNQNENPLLSPQLLLHPQHSVVLDACHTLFLLNSVDETRSDLELERKIQLGNHLLESTKPIFKGISKFRGTIMSEMAMAKMAILSRRIETSALNLNDDPTIKHLAQDVIQTLAESIELLKYEPTDQPEGKLAQTSSRQLEQFTSFIETLIPDFASFSQ